MTLLTRKEAAARLGISVSLLDQERSTGHLAFIQRKPGGKEVTMLELLKFIFSSFWTWTGFVILTCAVFDGIAEIIRAFRRGGKSTTYRTGEQEEKHG